MIELPVINISGSSMARAAAINYVIEKCKITVCDCGRRPRPGKLICEECAIKEIAVTEVFES